MQIVITETRPDTPAAFALLKELDDHLLALPYPAESRHAFTVDKLIAQKVAFFVAIVDGLPAGCGGVKGYGTAFGEVKRMFVRPEFRGKGIAKAVLDHISQYCKERNVAALRLETGVYQTDAIALYERCGFTRRGPFEDYREDPMSVYFEKTLG
jgi:putative acetyltransferase